MIVCMCHQVNSQQIREALEKGATNLDDLSAQTGLGTGCGLCVDYTEHMIEQAVAPRMGSSTQPTVNLFPLPCLPPGESPR